MRYPVDRCHIVAIVFLSFCCGLGQSHVVQHDQGSTYTDEWAVHIPGIDQEEAKAIAQQHNFVLIGQIMPDYYHFKHKHVSRRSTEPSPHHHASLSEHQKVLWVEQQVVKRRVKRQRQFNDPKWPRMWYLKRTGVNLDMNVMDAWNKGYTGGNVVVTILDDGIEKDHPDLKRNYDPLASFDVNSNDPDPQPRYDYSNENRHGTRCAGEVAAEANNNICSVGIAFNASIGGVRMLDGDVTDAVEAKSLSLNPHHIDIYSASWGPDDDGRTVDGPATLAKRAFLDGITNGRGGKGSIFVWASGNGGRDGDSCNCDGYTNSIYTLSISSVTENGHIPWYSEACSSTLATTYSSGSGGERQIVTTDLRKGCTETHTGTSASAPLAAGICALALQANPSLSWRDMQHIVVLTARPSTLRADDWTFNGKGRKVSHHFGYGLMDASAMVDLALNWTNVAEQHQCVKPSLPLSKSIPSQGTAEFLLESDGCVGDPSRAVEHVEHVEAVITLEAARRGEVEIYLTSPKNTRSTLLARRTRDSSSSGFTSWHFMTTHCWGETSKGVWKLQIRNFGTTSVLKNWSLVIFGTVARPQSGSHHAPQANPDIGCAEHQFFLNDNCYDECPDSFFPTYLHEANKYNAICQSCWDTCIKCESESSHQCSLCVHGYSLNNGTCSPTFPPTPITQTSQVNLVALGIGLVLFTIILFLVVFGLFQLFDQRCSRRHQYSATSTHDDEGNHIKIPNMGNGFNHAEQERALLSDDSEEESEQDDNGDVYTVDITDSVDKQVFLNS